MNGIIKRRDTYGSGLDPDAQAFLIATEITDATITTAINQLVIDLKGADLWDKMKAIYPIVGGTATTHKYNLKDPRDLDVAFRLVETGTNTHTANGITMNGTNGDLNTKCSMSANLSISNGCISIYQRDNRAARYTYDIGRPGFGIITKYSDGYAYFMWNGGFTASLSMANSSGLFSTIRDGGSTIGYKNGSMIITKSQTVTSLSSEEIHIGSLITTGFSASNYAFATIGDKMTQSESSTFYTIVQTFQTTLGRSV